MSRQLASIFIYNLDDPSGAGDFELTRFPSQINTTDAANWEAADVANFVKPLTYANNEPQTIELVDVWLDRSDTLESVLPDIEKLRALIRPRQWPGRGYQPPRLQLICGDWEVACVLNEVRTERTRFTNFNVVTRARLALKFTEVSPSS